MNFWSLFSALIPTVFNYSFPFPWQLIAPQKSGQIYIFKTTNDVYRYIHKIELKYTQKAAINGY
jgi:hypothetical protein